MKAVEFKKVNVRIAEHQEEFETLPAYYDKKEGSILYCMALTPEEIERVKETGVIWLKQLTNGDAMQPIASSILIEELVGDERSIDSF